MLKLKSGLNILKNGGIYREIDPLGKIIGKYCTVADNKKLPPTSRKGNFWCLYKKTPDNKKTN
jgi:hypothetical protein